MEFPTPLEIILDPISLTVLGMYAGLMIWEALFPARPLTKMKFWKLKGLSFFAGFFFLSSYLPIMVDPWLSQYQLINLSEVGTIPSMIFAILIYELGAFAYHWSMHRFDFMWRTFHQMHHSSERIDTYSAYIFSPLDMIGWTMLGSISLVWIVGLSPQAATATLLILTFLGIFQHANIKTPRWLGYLIQRPESHNIHHGRGIHKYNYADLPLWDILFGTFYNPSTYETEVGFYKGASNRIGDMLLFKDVSVPPTEKIQVNPQSTLDDNFFFQRDRR